MTKMAMRAGSISDQSNVSKPDPTPTPRSETIRQELLALLDRGELSAGELSRLMGQSEKEILGHLAHIQKSGRLRIEPARCRQCGFVFKNRARVRKPSRCPQCKSTHIEAPTFRVTS